MPTELRQIAFREAEFFIRVLTSKKFHLGALVLNKVLPEYLLDEASEARAARLCDEAGDLAGTDGLAELVGTDPAQLARVLAEVGENFRNFAVVARREAELRADLARSPELLVAVPELDEDIHDLAGLLHLGERLWTEED